MTSRRNVLRLLGGAGALPMVAVTVASAEVEITMPNTAKNRRILHVTVGDHDWEPSIKDMEEIANLFSEALKGDEAVIATRPGVTATLITIPLEPEIG